VAFFSARAAAIQVNVPEHHNWSAIGSITEAFTGQFLFTDPGAATNQQMFYRVTAP
jgi:hypothetical protein